MSKKPIALIIMDGFGYNHKDYGNAIRAAKTPNIDRLLANYPHTLIGASGMDVGLPEGQMGNSEVGHTNIGAGRIVYQELTRITKSIKDGEFFSNEAFTAAVENCKKNDSALHLFGLLSNGGVHSHNSHLYGLLELAKKAGLTKVYVHCFMDGRDVPPTSGADFVAELEEKLKEIGVGKIATVMGRYYAMDRDNRWERVGKAYDAMVYGEGNKADNAVDAIRASYAADVTDEFVVPTVIDENGKISANDSVIFFNFRPDRAREITRTLVDDDFTGFERRNGRFPLYYVCMTQYDATMPNVDVAFKPASLENTFCEYIAKKNCEVKYKVVMKDERESGLREVLNLGHTVGRAIETVSDYRLYHGEAVAIGMVAQSRLGEKFGFISHENEQRVEKLLERAKLPTKIPDYIDRKALVKKLYTDKKVRDGKLRFVFQKEIGEMMCFGENQYGKEISEEQIAEIITEM